MAAATGAHHGLQYTHGMYILTHNTHCISVSVRTYVYTHVIVYVSGY